LYAFLTGTGFVVSLCVFFAGMALRLLLYFGGLDQKLDRVAYRSWLATGMKGGLYSIFKWLLPFATHGWRRQPFVAVCFVLLHAGAIVVPLFLTAHALFLRNNFGFALPAVSQDVADMFTVLTLLGGLLIIVRRLALPQVRIISSGRDYLVLALVLLPFITGLLARLHAQGYEAWILLHLVSGELLLILAPFTRLSHIVLFFASRWQLGADFAIKRGGHRRGPCFPW
jgi:nitrate reductase gamma subunit